MIDYLTWVLLGLSLSVDSLAVSVTIGLCKINIRLWHAFKTAVVFAVFQTLMPAIGYFAGKSISKMIGSVDHWVAFGLLAFIGGKMIYESLHEVVVSNEEDAPACEKKDPTSTWNLTVLALSTSIDALAAGISLSVSRTGVLPALIIIGIITFMVTITGTLLGRRLGVLFHRKACQAGGIVLILIGLKILVEHIIAR